ncbi:MAG TPA: aminopeptidase P family protein, partial [Melioribacteraceae bacterium]|nr:aminopeptidase P family protein [Melioribacteraceae bacterium]
GNNPSPINYTANTYKFRQDSSFLYYFGLDYEGLFGVIDIDNNEEILFGTDLTLDDLVWTGAEPTLAEKASFCGVNKTMYFDKLYKYISNLFKQGALFHYLPQYRTDNLLHLSELLTINYKKLNQHTSKDLIKAIIRQRSVKEDIEISEIEKALDISYEMNLYALKNTKNGVSERDIYSFIEAYAFAKGHGTSFASIFSVNGDKLHNPYHNNIMKSGQLALLDSGAESLLHYASDITRTFPVSGKFTEFQKGIYNAVLNANLKAINFIKPGIPYREVHKIAAKTIVEHLKDLNLMKGNTDDAVENGAHALFFPHGLGHMLGLDVHDMEGLGEALVGYNEEITRSEQFGLKYLRLGRKLEPGFVLTVEPGVYFIPQLIKTWKEQNKFVEFINYDEAEKHTDFGGVRIEDDIMVTPNGAKVLGKPIPKTISEIENIMENN